MTYPLGLQLKGRRVLVAGGGAVAHRRVPRLVDAGALVVMTAPQAHPALRQLAREGRLEWRERAFEPADLDGSWLALAAGPPEVNAEVAELAERRRIFCVRSDDASGGTAWTPAIAEHDGALAAVFAGGDPRRSAELRDGVVAAWEAGRGHVPRRRRPRGGEVVLVGAGPGDPDLITVAGRKAVAAADVVIADRLAPPQLLESTRPDCDIVDASKIPEGEAADQAEINALMVERARAGAMVVRLKGGDGFVFGRGAEEVDACTAAGLPVRVIPGVSSALAAPALAGAPATERGVTHEFVVVSGHLPPGHPDSLVDWAALGRLRGTVMLLMAVRNRAAIAEALIGAGRDADTPTAVVMDASTPRQRVLRCRLRELGEQPARSPAVIVVGAAAARAVPTP